MQNGTPVIAFEGGPSETILDGQTGFIIKNHNLEEFAKKSILLIMNKELNDSFSRKAKEHVKEDFNLKKGISNLEAILRRVLSQE